MAHVSADGDTTATTQEVVGALTDFSEGRVALWPNIDRTYYKVHDVGRTSAEVTEGSRGIWERARYDWSKPGVVRIEVQDSNAFRPGSWWTYTVEARPEGGSHVHLEFDRRARNLRGLALSGLLSVAGKRIFSTFLRETLHRLEARRAATA